ncbi:MAG: hypothetical protein FWE38_04685 [Firmicutes bacterium]|nr:hypothetical protein [Bacillota bacterium]
MNKVVVVKSKQPKNIDYTAVRGSRSVLFAFSILFVMAALMTFAVWNFHGMALASAAGRTHTIAIFMSFDDVVDHEFTVAHGTTFNMTVADVLQYIAEEGHTIIMPGDSIAFTGWYVDAYRTIPYTGDEIRTDLNLFAGLVFVGEGSEQPPENSLPSNPNLV